VTTNDTCKDSGTLTAASSTSIPTGFTPLALEGLTYALVPAGQSAPAFTIAFGPENVATFMNSSQTGYSYYVFRKTGGNTGVITFFDQQDGSVTIANLTWSAAGNGSISFTENHQDGTVATGSGVFFSE